MELLAAYPLLIAGGFMAMLALTVWASERGVSGWSLSGGMTEQKTVLLL
jgi:hypothetical protein